jgi:hypothetical protein
MLFILISLLSFIFVQYCHYFREKERESERERKARARGRASEREKREKERLYYLIVIINVFPNYYLGTL